MALDWQRHALGRRYSTASVDSVICMSVCRRHGLYGRLSWILKCTACHERIEAVILQIKRHSSVFRRWTKRKPLTESRQNRLPTFLMHLMNILTYITTAQAARAERAVRIKVKKFVFCRKIKPYYEREFGRKLDGDLSSQVHVIEEQVTAVDVSLPL